MLIVATLAFGSGLRAQRLDRPNARDRGPGSGLGGDRGQPTRPM